MAERKSIYSFILDPANDLMDRGVVAPIQSGVEQAKNVVSEGVAQISDFGSKPKSLIDNVVSSGGSLFENAGNPVDVSGVDIGSILTGGGIVAPGSAGQGQMRGFKDPKDVWPTQHREGESDWHRFTGRPPEPIEEKQLDSVTAIPPQPQTEYEKTHVQTRHESRVGEINEVRTAAAPAWEEPKSDKKTVYGDNWVWASPGGVTMEMDSTLGGQAYRITHPSNSFMEINSTGQFIQKTFADRFDIIAKDHKTLINLNRSTTIQANDDLRVQGEQAIVIDGKKNEINQSDSSLTVMASYVRNVSENDALIVGKDQNATIQGTQHEIIMKDQILTVMQNQDVTIGMVKTEMVGQNYDFFAAAGIKMRSASTYEMFAGSQMSLKAAIIRLN